VDLDDPSLRRRSWRWLKLRIVGLVSAESRLSRALAPPEDSSATSSTNAMRSSAYDDPE